MTESSFVWSGTTPGDGGPYSDDTFAKFVRAMMQGYDKGEASVLQGTGDGSNPVLDVQQSSPAAKTIRVREGVAIVEGRMYFSDAIVTLTIDDNTNGSGFDRLDLIILRIDYTAQTVRLKTLKGTESGSPVRPTLTKSGSIYEVALAEVQADNLFSTIVNGDINNSLRTEGVSWQARQGGTGLDDYVVGNLIVGSGAHSLSKLSPPTQIGGLRYDSTDSSLMKWQDQRICEIYTTESNVGISASYSSETLDVFNDATSDIVDTLVANQLKLKAGTYRLIFGLAIVRTNSSAANEIAMRLQNVTAASTIVEGSGGAIENAALANFNLMFQPIIFTMNGTDLIEWQFSCEVASSTGQTGDVGAERSFKWSRMITLERVDT